MEQQQQKIKNKRNYLCDDVKGTMIGQIEDEVVECGDGVLERQLAYLLELSVSHDHHFIGCLQWCEHINEMNKINGFGHCHVTPFLLLSYQVLRQH